jgi:hypothetical protein
MRLRTILNELPITSSYIHDDELLEWDLIVSPEWNVGSKGVVCLGSMADFQSNDVPQTGDGIMLVYVQGELDEQYHKPPRNVVFVTGEASPSDFQEAFMRLVLKSGELAVRREALFRCYLDSYDLRQFARRASEVIGNPVVISNTDHKVLATAGEIPSDRPDIAATVENGYVSQSVEDHLAESGILSSVRSSRHSIITTNVADNLRCVTSIIYHHRLEMGRFDAFEVTHEVTGVDLELIDFATSLAGLMIDRLGVAGKRVDMGSSVLADVLSGKFEDKGAVREHLRIADVPLDCNYVLLRVVGQPGAGHDYYARVGQLVGDALSGSVWTIFGSAVVVLVSLGEAAGQGFGDYETCERRILRDRSFMASLEHNDMRAFVSEPFSDVMLVRPPPQAVHPSRRGGRPREGGAPARGLLLGEALPDGGIRLQGPWLLRHAPRQARGGDGALRPSARERLPRDGGDVGALPGKPRRGGGGPQRAQEHLLLPREQD